MYLSPSPEDDKSHLGRPVRVASVYVQLYFTSAAGGQMESIASLALRSSANIMAKDSCF